MIILKYHAPSWRERKEVNKRKDMEGKERKAGKDEKILGNKEAGKENACA